MPVWGSQSRTLDVQLGGWLPKLARVFASCEKATERTAPKCSPKSRFNSPVFASQSFSFPGVASSALITDEPSARIRCEPLVASNVPSAENATQ